MYYLRFDHNNNEKYIWANSDNLDEWCVSNFPCGFTRLDDVQQLYNNVLETNIDPQFLSIIKDENPSCYQSNLF